MTILRRIMGALCGLIVGAIGCAIFRMTVGGGLSLGSLFPQLLPGMLLGGVLGFFFPAPFLALVDILSGMFG